MDSVKDCQQKLRELEHEAKLAENVYKLGLKQVVDSFNVRINTINKQRSELIRELARLNEARLAKLGKT